MVVSAIQTRPDNTKSKCTPLGSDVWSVHVTTNAGGPDNRASNIEGTGRCGWPQLQLLTVASVVKPAVTRRNNSRLTDLLTWYFRQVPTYFRYLKNLGSASTLTTTVHVAINSRAFDAGLHASGRSNALKSSWRLIWAPHSRRKISGLRTLSTRIDSPLPQVQHLFCFPIVRAFRASAMEAEHEPVAPGPQAAAN